jgi:transcription antitermination factor NusA-like protein
MGNCINRKPTHITQSLSSSTSTDSSDRSSHVSRESNEKNQDSLSFELEHIERTIEEIESISDAETESNISIPKADPVGKAVGPNIKSTQSNQTAINNNPFNLDIFKPPRIKKFFKQDVEKIKQSKARFVDKTFPPSIQIITKSVQSEFAQQLFNNYQVQNRYTLNELGQKIRWQPTKV